MIALWGSIGGNRMIIFLAGLQGVPQELYEAAEIDGAEPLERFRHVTLPMISPTIFFNLVLGIIGALRSSPRLRRHRRRPGLRDLVLRLHIYQKPSSTSIWATPRRWPGSSSS